MDYTKVPRELIYRDRNDVLDFDVQDTLSHEYIYLQKLMDRPFMKTDESSHYALRIFNNAHYICTLILMTPIPKLFLYQYFKIAKDNNPRSIEWANHVMPATMAFVYNLLRYNRSFFPEHPFMKAIWDSFLDWDIKGAPQGKADFYELIVDWQRPENFPLDPLAPRFIIDALATEDPIFIVHGIEYVLSAIKNLEDWPEGSIYKKKSIGLVLSKLRQFEHYDSERPLTSVIEELQSLQKRYGVEDELVHEPILIEPQKNESKEQEQLQAVIDEQKSQMEKLQAENAIIPQLQQKVSELQKQLSEKQPEIETIEIPRLKIRIELLNFLFRELGYDVEWMTKKRKVSALARVYAAILGHNTPKSLCSYVGRVTFNERPKELDSEIKEINTLLRVINEDWKIKL